MTAARAAPTPRAKNIKIEGYLFVFVFVLVLVLVIVIVIEIYMPQFDHEKLDVYKVSLEFNRQITELVCLLHDTNRHARDQLLRAALSIPLNIAEGNGKRSIGDRKRYFEIARGSAMESAAVLDILAITNVCPIGAVEQCKTYLVRIVSMLSRMTENPNVIREDETAYT